MKEILLPSFTVLPRRHGFCFLTCFYHRLDILVLFQWFLSFYTLFHTQTGFELIRPSQVLLVSFFPTFLVPNPFVWIRFPKLIARKSPSKWFAESIINLPIKSKSLERERQNCFHWWKKIWRAFLFFIIDLTRIRVCTVCVSRVEKNRAPGGWNLTQLERERYPRCTFCSFFPPSLSPLLCLSPPVRPAAPPQSLTVKLTQYQNVWMHFHRWYYRHYYIRMCYHSM